MNFSELAQKISDNNTVITETSDINYIISLIKSKASCTWGQGVIEDTGWVQLAQFSPIKLGYKRTLVVCTIDNFIKASEQIKK